jgi:hypothetical protein
LLVVAKLLDAPPFFIKEGKVFMTATTEKPGVWKGQDRQRRR